MVKVTCLLAKAGSGVGLSFGVRALTQMEIRCVKGMFRLKLISSEKNSVFKGLNDDWIIIDHQHTSLWHCIIIIMLSSGICLMLKNCYMWH